jgi:hypothetical protein
MPLPVPTLTFSKTDKGEEYLPRDQVTRLVDDLQRAHKEALAEGLKAPQAEVTRLEAALKEAKKGADKVPDLENRLSELQSATERRDVAAELLGLSDPGEIGDLHGLYQSRTAGLEADKRPAFKAWVEQGLQAPDQVPALARPLFESAIARRQQAGAGAGGQGGGRQTGAGGQGQGAGQGAGQGVQGRQVQTGGGRVAAPSGGQKRLSVAGIMEARRQGTSTMDLINQRRAELGLPPHPVDSGEGQK